MKKNSTTNKPATGVKDFKTMAYMKKMDAYFDEIERMLDEGDIPELDDFYQYCDREKMERYNRLKIACKTMSDASRYKDFVFEKAMEPNNTAPTGTVCVLIKVPVFFTHEQYKALLDIASLANGIAICYINNKVARVSFSVDFVFYN